MRRAVFAVIALLVIGCAAVIAAGSMLSRPVRRVIGDAPAPLRATNVAFRSDSGATIRGWWAKSDERRGTVLLLPGVRANRTSMIDRALFLREAGYSVLLIDLQGTGESGGDAITFGWRERLDVLAAVRFIRAQLPGEPVAIIGTSLGGAAALLATPPLEVDALVLEAVYPSVERAVDNRMTMRLGAFGRLLSPLLLVQLRPRLGVSADKLRPVEHIAQVKCPVLIIGGMNDRHTTVADTQLLYRAARAPKELWLVPGAAHVDIQRARGDEYRERVLRFLAASAGSAARR